MKKSLFILIGILFSGLVFSQEMDQYSSLVKEANDLYEVKKYAESADKYEAAFATIEGKATPNDRYNAACSHALSGNTDTAFYHLFRLAESVTKYKNYHHITTDPDLKSLHEDSRWEKLIAVVKANKEKAEENLDKELVAILDVIHEEDQKYRVALDTIEEKYGWDSDEVRAQWEIINEKDSLNLIEVSRILDERGWLGADVVGDQGNSTLFLVVQHADLEVQEKYLPMMREAVKNGNARASSLALLEDRVALRQGKKQIYGSQIIQLEGKYYVQPLEDPENVDKRRVEVGLSPLKDYVSIWKIEWNVEEYMKSLPELEEKMKK